MPRSASAPARSLSFLKNIVASLWNCLGASRRLLPRPIPAEICGTSSMRAKSALVNATHASSASFV